MPATPRILFIGAHPDDESFAVAGVSRHYANAGAEIALVTATRGDAGKCGDPPVCSREELPAVREAELRHAASILGISLVHLLDYRDQHLAEADPDRIRQELVTFIRSHRPHLVITFDLNGVNRHADHIAISRFATDAVSAAADARWYPQAGAPHQVQRLLWTTMTPWDAARSANLSQEPGVDVIFDAEPYRAAKAEALRTHRTQHLSINRCFFDNADVEQILSVEVFRQAWGPGLDRVPMDDLLAGISL